MKISKEWTSEERIAIATMGLKNLQNKLTINNNIYDGRWIPNITSIVHILAEDKDLLEMSRATIEAFVEENEIDESITDEEEI